MFWSIVCCSALAVALNIVALFLHLAIYRNHKPAFFPPCVLGLTAAILVLASAAIDLRLANPSSRRPRWWTIQTVIQNIAFLSCLAALIFSLIIVTLQGIGAEGKYLDYFDTGDPAKLVLAALFSLSIVLDLVLGALVARLTWSPVHRFARSTMTISSLLLFAVGTVLLAVNRAPFVESGMKMRLMPTITFTIYQHAAAILSSTAVLGFVVSFLTKDGNRINALLTRFIRCYIIFASFVAILSFILIFLSIHVLLDSSIKNYVQRATLISDPVLGGTALFLLAINFVAANYIQEPPTSHLAVEPIDLSALTQSQRDAYVNLITLHGRLLPDAPTGDPAISLMQTYADLDLPGMKCTVLRVYRPPISVPKIMRRGLTPEDDRAWQHLDVEQFILKDKVVITEPAPPPPKLSRNQKKKLAKKQAASGEVPRPSSLPDLEFAAKLASTEALVLLTTIASYDLTTPIRGVKGSILRFALGRFLTVRFGLLAFHWPFRPSTFYCSSARKPVARAAAVRRAIQEWNDQRVDRCDVLLDPTYRNGPAERSIVPSGWSPTPMFPSHIIDLRPYSAKSLHEYLKAIKYRDQEAAFKRAGGEVVEDDEFGEASCKEARRLWGMIADKREREGDTGVLAVPDENYFATVGKGSGGKRSLLFLRIPDPNATDRLINIASCVLFRLGSTLTSELHGLDYTHARPLKAYFVMMQHVIAIALDQGFDFVDFGPTTAKAKMDIGCMSVPMVGAMCASGPLLGAVIKLAAGRTRRNFEKERGKACSIQS